MQAGRGLVYREHRALVDDGVALGDGEGVGVQAAAQGTVAEVADHAELGGIDVAVDVGSRGVDAVVQALGFKGDLRDQVGAAGTDERVEAVDRVHRADAVRQRGGEVLAELVMERRVAGADARAPVADRYHVGGPVEAHVLVGGEGTVRELVADRERVAQVETDAAAQRAGIAVAVVIDVDRAADQAGGIIRNADDEVGRADRLAGLDLGGDGRVRQVVQQQQRRLEAGLGDDRALDQVLLDDAAHQAFAVARAFLQVQRHLADARLDDRDFHHAALDLLLRQVGLHEEVATLAVIGAHLGRGVVQAVDRLFLADELLDLGEQHFLGVDGVAGDVEAVDDQLQAGRTQRRARLGSAR